MKRDLKFAIFRFFAKRWVHLIPAYKYIKPYLLGWLLNCNGKLRVLVNVKVRHLNKTPEDFKLVDDLGIKLGDECLFADDCEIDVTGNIIAGYRAAFADGCKVFTHFVDENTGKVVPNTLTVGDQAKIGTRVVITHKCHNIGREASVGAGSIVTSDVPPYAMVIGDPAMVIGFKKTPEEVKEYEENLYEQKLRTNLDEYAKMYQNLFIDRCAEINKFVRL